MKIEKLKVEGFRSLMSVSWEPSDLNVLIGPNASGKSNLLRLLELAALSAQGRLGKHIQASGGIEPLLWDGEATSLGLQIDVRSSEDPLAPERYELELARLGKGTSYRVRYEMLTNWLRVRQGRKQDPFKFLERTERHAWVFDEHEHKFVTPVESLSEEETLLSLATGPFSYHKAIPVFRTELASIAVYHDLHVNRDASIRQPTVARVEKRVDPDGQNLISVLHTLYTGDREFKREVDSAMKVAFGEDYEELVFPPAADQTIQLRLRWRSLKREQSAADLSDGTLRFLFLLTVLASPSPAPVIAIDEPETGLHPSMLPIVAEYAVEAARRCQVILTTHSPQVLDAFHEKPATTVVKRYEGKTNLQQLSGPDLEYWLKEYSLGALFKSGELEAMP